MKTFLATFAVLAALAVGGFNVAQAGDGGGSGGGCGGSCPSSE